MKDGFLKAAALSPALRVADCTCNVRQITDALHKAAARGVKLAVFPEFCLTGYTCGDLFLQRTLQTGALVKVWHKDTFLPISFPNCQVPLLQPLCWVHYRYFSYPP